MDSLLKTLQPGDAWYQNLSWNLIQNSYYSLVYHKDHQQLPKADKINEYILLVVNE